MKKGIIYIIGLVLLSSCEDVVEVDLPEVEPKLIVDGLVRVDKSEEFITIEIGLKESTDFFEENLPVQADSVVISYGTMTENGLFELQGSSQLVEKEPETGIYVPDSDQPADQRIPAAVAEPGTIFILEIFYEDSHYFAQTEYIPTVPIDNLEQGDDTLFGEDETELIITITDTPGRDDYYLFDFMFGEFLTVEDTFVKGQQFQFSYFYDDNLNAGQDVTISILGASKEFYNYMGLVLEQSGNNGGVFQTPVATAIGNVFDITGFDPMEMLHGEQQPNDFALGYFAVAQTYSRTITIE